MAAAVAVLGAVVLPPLVAVGRELVGVSGVLGLLGGASLWWLLVRSLALAIAVTVLALGIGVPLGVLFARASFPFRKALLVAHVAIVCLPPFLPALGWFHLFGREGLLGDALSTRLLFSEFGVVLVLAVCFTPIVTALTALGVAGVDASLEEAARLVSGPWRVAALVLIPCAAPVIALAGILVFTLALSELGVPMFLRVNVYPAVVFARLGGMDFAPGEAAVFVLPLVVVAALVLVFERRFAGGRAIASLAGARTAREPLLAYRPWIVAVAGLGAIGSTLPLGALVLQTMNLGGLADAGDWLGDAPWNSLRASLLASVVMTALGLVLGHALARRTSVGVWLDRVSMLIFVLPSSILGVGIMAAWNHASTNWLYGSYGVLVVGFVARYSAVVTRAFAASVAQVPNSFEDAARAVGAAYLRRLVLLARFSWRGLVAAFVLGLVFALRDLETAALFYPPGGEPLSVRIFTLEANGPPHVVAGLAVLQIAITFGAVGVGWLAFRAKATA